MRLRDAVRCIGMRCCAALLMATAWAAPGECAAIANDVHRLACYDAAAQREQAKPAMSAENYGLRPAVAKPLGVVNLPRPGSYLLPAGYPLLLGDAISSEEGSVSAGRLNWRPVSYERHPSAQASPLSVLAF